MNGGPGFFVAASSLADFAATPGSPSCALPLPCKGDPLAFHEPVCCGTKCHPNGIATHCVYPGTTNCGVFLDSCAAYSSSANGDGVLCCKDSEIMGH